MSTMALPVSHPLLRTATLGVHGFVAAWLLVNGVAHQVGVIVKARGGTLKPGADVSSLLAVGAGLIIAGGLSSWSLGPLWRAESPSSVPAFAGIGVLAAVIALTAMAYGFTFLRTSIALCVIDLAFVAAHTALNKR